MSVSEKDEKKPNDIIEQKQDHSGCFKKCESFILHQDSGLMTHKTEPSFLIQKRSISNHCLTALTPKVHIPKRFPHPVILFVPQPHELRSNP